MAVDNKYERATENDPNRCQMVIPKFGQCPYKALPGTKNCPMHGGTREQDTNKQYQLAKYRLQQYGERIGEFATDNEIKSLREEIGILRMTLESLLNSLTDKNKLLLFIDKIQQLVNQITKTVECAQRMEEKTNTLLDRKVVVIIADSMVQIVAEYVKDPDQLTMIGERICASIESAASATLDGGTFTKVNHGAVTVG